MENFEGKVNVSMYYLKRCKLKIIESVNNDGFCFLIKDCLTWIQGAFEPIQFISTGCSRHKSLSTIQRSKA